MANPTPTEILERVEEIEKRRQPSPDWSLSQTLKDSSWLCQQIRVALQARDEIFTMTITPEAPPETLPCGHTYRIRDCRIIGELAIKAVHDPDAEGTQWQPIETAPKDYTAVLVSGWNGARAGDGIQFVTAAVYGSGRREWYCPDENGDITADDAPENYYLNITHWMPLPGAPRP